MKINLLKLIIIVLLILLTHEIYLIIYTDITSKKEVENYCINAKKYIYSDKLVLEIPKINLKQIVNKTVNDYKNLDYSLVYYNNNNYNKKIIIFGHSGMGYGTYFNRLDNLSINDTIYLYKNNYKITYKVNKIYHIKENNLSVLNIDDSKELYLITCVKYDKSKRLVIKSVQNSVKPLKNKQK